MSSCYALHSHNVYALAKDRHRRGPGHNLLEVNGHMLKHETLTLKPFQFICYQLTLQVIKHLGPNIST